MKKPIIIDYPENRSKLREEFEKIINFDREAICKSIAMAKELIYGKNYEKKSKTKKKSTKT